MADTEFNDWYITMRPRTFDEVLFQPTLIKYLKECQKTDTWPRATFLSSGFGQGKTTIAKIMALHLACRNRDEKGEPCLECPSCRSIINETWDRDTLLLNASVDGGKDDLEQVLNGFMAAPAIRDRNKVLIIDETQALGATQLSTLLKILESPRKNQYIILTDMGGKGGAATEYALRALKSRCKIWKLQTPSVKQIYDGLASFVKSHRDLIDIKEAPVSFWQEDGLGLIATNSEGSFRKAIQLLEQCYKGKLFDPREIKETFDIVSYDDMGKLVAELSCGNIDSDLVFDTIAGKEYQDKFNLAYTIVSTSEMYRAFGKLSNEESEKWKEAQAKVISSGPYFDLVREAFKKLAGFTFIKRGEWQLVMSELVNRIKKEKGFRLPEVEKNEPENLGDKQIPQRRRRELK